MNQNQEKPVRVVPRCKGCGLRIRGRNHEEGIHHKRRVEAEAKKK